MVVAIGYVVVGMSVRVSIVIMLIWYLISLIKTVQVVLASNVVRSMVTVVS